jgi:hypothetical protein
MHHDMAMRHAPILSVNCNRDLSVSYKRQLESPVWSTHPCGDREWPAGSVTPVLAGPSPRGFRRTRLCGFGAF